MERVLLSIGSNLFDPVYQVHCALCSLVRYHPHIKLVACSSYYESRPLGGANQPNYLNVVVIIDTIFFPLELLDYVQWIEICQGRIRKDRWDSRSLDIDILLFGNRIISTNRLVIPHYDMLNREFVLYPLFELIPDFCFLNGKTLFEYLNVLPKNGLKLWDKRK